MARQPRTDNTNDKQEQIEVLSNDDHDVELAPVDDAATAVVVADATKKVVSEVEAPPIKKYVVVKGGSVLENGFRTMLKEGKVIDSLNYDIARLQRQGIRLQREESFTHELVE